MVELLLDKPWLVGIFDKYLTNIQPESQTPRPRGEGFINDLGKELRICLIHCNSCSLYDIYYGDVILVQCRLYLQ